MACGIFWIPRLPHGGERSVWRTSQGAQAPDSERSIQMTYNVLGRMASYANAATQTNASCAYDATRQRTRSMVTKNNVASTTDSSPTYFSIVTNDRGDVLELRGAHGSPFASHRYDAWGLPLGASADTRVGLSVMRLTSRYLPQQTRTVLDDDPKPSHGHYYSG